MHFWFDARFQVCRGRVQPNAAVALWGLDVDHSDCHHLADAAVEGDEKLEEEPKPVKAVKSVTFWSLGTRAASAQQARAASANCGT